MNAEILEILRCPITHNSLELMAQDELLQFKDKMKKQIPGNFDGELEAILVNKSHSYGYPVVGGIICLLKDYSIPLQSTLDNEELDSSNDQIKKKVQKFYNDFGWSRSETAVFQDTLIFEDLRSVAKDYVHHSHMRLKRYIKAKGKFLVDVASGPIPFAEYLTYSDGHQYRVCVDLSYLALKQARAKIKEKGVFILGDITNLPLQDGIADAAVSLHTIYHVPQNEQIKAFKEIERILKANSQGVVVYAWEKSWPVKIGIAIRNFLRPDLSAPQGLYFKAHNLAWYQQNLKSQFNVKLACWRSLSVPMMRIIIHPLFFGKFILSLLHALESRFPHFFGKHGYHPMIVISKRNEN